MAELQSPKTKGPNYSSAFNIKLADKYFTCDFII